MNFQELCFRGEGRARFLEGGGQPRSHQCGDATNAVGGCYMFRPVIPVVVAQTDEEDTRPQFGPAMITACSHGVRLAEGENAIMKVKDGRVLYFKVKE